LPKPRIAALIYGEFDNDLVKINGLLEATGIIQSNDEISISKGTQLATFRSDDANNYVQLDVDGTGHSSDRIYIGDLTNPTNEVIMNGDVGIGTTAPGFKLQVGENGDGTIARANEWSTFSDRRLKRDFQSIENPLEKLAQLNGYYYYWTKDKNDQTRQLGVVAQEVEAVLPEIVSTSEDGIKSVDYSKLTALLIEVNKAQENKMEQQGIRIAALEKQLKEWGLLKASLAE